MYMYNGNRDQEKNNKMLGSWPKVAQTAPINPVLM